MDLNRTPVWWVSAPDPDDPDDIERYITFRLRDTEFHTDDEQLIARITMLERDGQSGIEEDGLLKQYGGSEMLIDMLTSDQDVEEGSIWTILHNNSGRYITPEPEYRD